MVKLSRVQWHEEGEDDKFNFKYLRFEMLLKMPIRQLFVVYRRACRSDTDLEVISTRPALTHQEPIRPQWEEGKVKDRARSPGL